MRSKDLLKHSLQPPTTRCKPMCEKGECQVPASSLLSAPFRRRLCLQVAALAIDAFTSLTATARLQDCDDVSVAKSHKFQLEVIEQSRKEMERLLRILPAQVHPQAGLGLKRSRPAWSKSRARLILSGPHATQHYFPGIHNFQTDIHTSETRTGSLPCECPSVPPHAWCPVKQLPRNLTLGCQS